MMYMQQQDKQEDIEYNVLSTKLVDHYRWHLLDCQLLMKCIGHKQSRDTKHIKIILINKVFAQTISELWII